MMSLFDLTLLLTKLPDFVNAKMMPKKKVQNGSQLSILRLAWLDSSIVIIIIIIVIIVR